MRARTAAPCAHGAHVIKVAEDSLTSLQGSTRGQLHLGAVPTANYFAPLLMMAFRQRFPEVKLKLSVDRRDAILAMLNEHRIDVAIAGYPPSEADVEAEAFARHPHCIVAAPDHPLGRPAQHRVGSTACRAVHLPRAGLGHARLPGAPAAGASRCRST
jgi:DNA-binding transcriptional LysR family regulator